MKSLTVALSALLCGVAACARTAPEPKATAAPDSAAPPAAATPVKDTSSLPMFAPGLYDLVLVRGKPLIDDSARAQLVVDTGYAWGPLDAALTAADSTRVLIASIDAQDPQWGEDRYALKQAVSAGDSAKVVADYFMGTRCIAWHVGSELQMEASGRYTAKHFWRQYCRRGRPDFTRYERVEHDSLGACDEPGADLVSQIPHRTCVYARERRDRLPYRHVGDTLTIGRDCDGRDTFILRTVQPQRALASTAIFRDNRGC